MIFEELGKALKPDRKIYDFNMLNINGKTYKVGDSLNDGVIVHLKAKMDYSDPIAVVHDEDNDIINHYEL